MKSYKKKGRKIASTWGRTSKGNKRIANKGVRKANKLTIKDYLATPKGIAFYRKLIIES